MMYTRASASDYDAWKTVYENPGWGSDDLIPLLRKVCARDPTLALLFIHAAHATVISAPTQTETYQIPGDGPTHGTDGPLNVAFAIEGSLGDLGEQFLQVARALDPARARARPDTDTNDLSTINVYTVGVLLLSLIQTRHVLMRLHAR
jgi:alcohol oxidase